jgi:hypothetical protein
MTVAEYMKSLGATQTVANTAGDPNDPANIAWNFGVAPPLMGSDTARDAAPTLYDRFPALQGKWDGKTSVNHHNAVRKVLGTDIAPHFQPNGTCGGRAGSRGLEILQAVMMANGKRAKFKYVSHAWLYFLARRDYNMLGGGDGVPDGAIPVVMEKYGCLHRDEAGDPDMNSPRSDLVAVKWGGGGLRGAELASMTALAKDNPVTARVRVKSAAELADGIAAGGVAICSDAQGYAMTRDNDGFCRASGTWYHYHVRSGIVVTASGRKGFAYDQSWGKTNPGGPILEGYPSNCFAVDWDVQDRLCRSGSVDVVFGFDLWDLESGNVNPWVF